MPGSTPLRRIRSNRLIHELAKMKLDPDSFVIFGSAPMLAHGLRTAVRDLDVVARGEVWRQVSSTGKPARGTYSGDRVWQFCDGRLQFSRCWITNGWNTDELIDNAEVIDGLRFASLEAVLQYKQELKRPKDRADIAALKIYLGAGAVLLVG